MAQTGQNLPQGGTNPYIYVGFTLANAAQTTLTANWQTGLNTIIVQVKSSGPAIGFDAQVRQTALCPGIDVTKSVASRANADDQFTVQVLDSSGNVVTSVTTTGTETTATSPTGGPLVNGETYTITDTLRSGSPSPIAAYTRSITCADPITGQPVPVGGSPGAWTIQAVQQTNLFEQISCTVTNSATTDLSVAKTSSPNPYLAGQTLTYTVTVTNNGPAPANGATVDDPPPAELQGAGFTWTCTAATIPAGSSCGAENGPAPLHDMPTIAAGGGSVTYVVTGTVPAGTTAQLVNTVTATPPPGVTDPGCPLPNGCSATDYNPVATVGLSVTKMASPSPYTAGRPLTYTVTVDNAGPDSVAGVAVTDPLPSDLRGAGFTWTCTAAATPAGSSCGAGGGPAPLTDAPTIAAGGSVTYTITGTVPAATSGTLTNTVTVTPPAGAVDPQCTPDCAATVNTPQTTVELSVTKTSSPKPYLAGQPLTYTVTVTNNGVDTASGANVADPLPGALQEAGFSWTCTAAAMPAGSACGAASGPAPLSDTPTIAGGGGTVTYTITGTVPAGATGDLVNTATVTPPPGTSDPTCSPDCSAVDTNPQAAVSPPKPGQPTTPPAPPGLPNTGAQSSGSEPGRGGPAPPPLLLLQALGVVGLAGASILSRGRRWRRHP